MKILLAIDSSEDSMGAARSVAHRLLPPGTAVHIVTAYDKSYIPSTTPGTIGTVEFHEASNDPEAKMARDVTSTAARLIREAQPNVMVTEVQVDGAPKKVILEEAEKFGADLIVMGSKGHNMLERLLLGSVSKHVSENAHCSVEIVR